MATQMQITAPGNYGSKRQSWAHKNPRDLLLAVVKANKGATEEQIYARFRSELKRHPLLLPAIFEYWFANNYRAITNPRTSAHKAALAAAHLNRVKAIIGQIKLLALVMPSGKTLAACTGSECVVWGGWYSRVGLRAGNRKVGDVFSEAQLRKVI